MRACASAPLVCLSLLVIIYFYSSLGTLGIDNYCEGKDTEIIESHCLDRGWPRTFETPRPGEPLVP